MEREALFQITYGLYVISAKKENGFSGCIINTAVQTTDEPLTITISVNKNSETCQTILNNREFMISVLAKEVEPFIISNFGFQTGREENKWKNISYEMKEGLPCIPNSSAYFYCKVEKVVDNHTHNLFLCEVRNAWNGNMEPITYDYYQKRIKNKAKEAFEQFKGKQQTEKQDHKKERWVCKICGYVYDGEKPFEELSDYWSCPWCSHPKRDFVKQKLE